MRLILGVIIMVAVIIALPYFIKGPIEGEKVWSHHTGILEWVDVDSDTCCHCRCWIKLENQTKLWTVDCNDDLENMFTIGEVYTFYLQPCEEMYAATTGSYWDQCIDYVEDGDGNVVYGWKWW